jgi:hypothetical protein
MPETVFERHFTLVALEKGVSFAEGRVLRYDALEEGCDSGVVGEHESGNSMRRGHVGRLLGQCYLDRSRTPGNEGRETPFSNAHE